jgi:putative transposase
MAVGLPRATFYRRRSPKKPASARQSPRRLSDAERAEVLSVLNEDRFADLAPAQVYATLLNEGRFLCSLRTMHRILEQAGESRERRDQLRHPVRSVPRLVAKAPNQVWSWDITKLLGPVKWTYFYLYVVIDIFSRYVVGWTLSRRESAALAEKLIATCSHRFGIVEGQLTLHADRGSSMTSKPVALLLADLGVTKSHSRPRVSNDNPFSEAQFKTLKYRPNFPDRFGSLQDARTYCRDFFLWYNTRHHHSALGLLTPADVHFGRVQAILSARAAVLERAYQDHPERFPRGIPVPTQPALEVWINRPSTNTVEPSKHENDGSELIETG